jgi:hypothetical protein
VETLEIQKMGMGTFAVNSYVIEYDELKKICPDEIAAIEKEKYFDSVGWNSIGYWMSWDDPYQFEENILESLDNPESEHSEKIAEEMVEVYDIHIINLQKSFNEKTGLTLYFDNYDEDNGDRYDNPGDKDGCIFCVDGMVQLTPAGEKFKDIVTQRRWTQFG